MKLIRQQAIGILVAALLVSCAAKKPFTPTGSLISSQGTSSTYGGANKEYDTRLLTMREEIAPRFQTLTFADTETGGTMEYNLFVPANYDPSKKYPLVLFMADASTVGKGVVAPLKQGYGGIIWATDESQREHPSFVLVPSYKGPQSATNDAWEVSPEVATTYHLLQSVLSSYSIDKNRVYTTGQSMGGMISFYLNVQYPDLFAASMFVGSQWDPAVLAPLAKKHFLYIVSAADPKASKGMSELGAILQEQQVPYGEVEFSAKLPQAEQDALVGELLQQGKPINFIRFSPNTVVPESMSSWKGGEHMYSFDYAYLLKPVRDWLFQQKK